MELRHLRYFVALAEELNFGRAAARLCITQPPLSFNIKQLEEELGVVLLERDNKRVALTQAGSAFLVEARAILEKADRARALARAVGAGRKGQLDIGFSGSTIYLDLAAITTRFQSQLPDVGLIFHEAGLPDQVAALEHGNLDLGFVDSISVPEGLDGLLLREEPHVCCIPASHRLADAHQIELAQLEGEAFVSFRRQGSPTTYDRLLAMCLAAGFTPRIVHAVRQWLTIIALVSENFGVALVPQRMSRTQFGGVRFIPLAADSVTSAGRLLWNPARMNDRIRRFITTARDVSSQAADD